VHPASSSPHLPAMSAVSMVAPSSVKAGFTCADAPTTTPLLPPSSCASPSDAYVTPSASNTITVSAPLVAA